MAPAHTVTLNQTNNNTEITSKIENLRDGCMGPAHTVTLNQTNNNTEITSKIENL